MRHYFSGHPVQSCHQYNSGSDSDTRIQHSLCATATSQGTKQTQECATEYESVDYGNGCIQNQDLTEASEEKDFGGEKRESCEDCGQSRLGIETIIAITLSQASIT